MVYQWVTQSTKGSIDNGWRPGRGSMMRPTTNEESDNLRKKFATTTSGRWLNKLFEINDCMEILSCILLSYEFKIVSNE